MTEREEGTVAESTSTQEAEEGVQLEEDAEANVSEYTLSLIHISEPTRPY